MENNELRILLQKISPDSILKIIISNKRLKDYKYNKIVITPFENNGVKCFAVESFTQKQAFRAAVGVRELIDLFENELTNNFKQLDGYLIGKNISVKLSKKNKILYSESKTSAEPPSFAAGGHNREKNYILPKGTYVPALFELGVITEDGKVVNSMFDKFKQINRFIEIIDDSLKDIKGDINVIDFGCGKSYLTFVLYYYLTEIKKVKANIVGLDLKKDVIEKCNKTAQKYGYDGLHFFCGDIKDYKADFKPDAVITLHACDTATDYALYNSVMWGAKYIFSVPCCQHEVNNSIIPEKLDILTDYGIIKERMSSLITDTVRAKLLEYCGYSVDLMEFIDIAHSPKNLLIRAKKSNIPQKKKNDSLKKIEDLQKEFSFSHTLCKLILENKKEQK